MSASDQNPCEFLTWDSDHFGLRIGRVNAGVLSRETMLEIDQWRKEQRMDCLYLLMNVSEQESIKLAEMSGFHFVDARLTFALSTEKSHRSGNLPQTIRLSTVEDIPALKRMAGELHQDSRFFGDMRFLREKSRALFETWIEKACLSGTHRVFVSELESKPTGYIACEQQSEHDGQIQLVGVDAHARGKGLGSQLILAALNWFAAEGIDRVTVITQGKNIPAQRMYQKQGFLSQSMQLWYHWWKS